MDEQMMDDILIHLGMLVAGRKWRKEGEKYVSVEFPCPADSYHTAYNFVWNTGNTLDICYEDVDSGHQEKVATIYPYRFLIFDRLLAIQIYGILVGDMRRRFPEWKGE